MRLLLIIFVLIVILSQQPVLVEAFYSVILRKIGKKKQKKFWNFVNKGTVRRIQNCINYFGHFYLMVPKLKYIYSCYNIFFNILTPSKCYPLGLFLEQDIL